MKFYLVALSFTFLIGCNQTRKDNQSTNYDYTTTTNSGPPHVNVVTTNIDSMVAWIDKSQYDSSMIATIRKRVELYPAVPNIRYEQEVTPEILDIMFSNPELYKIPATVDDSPCDGFYTIERNQFRSGTKTSYTSVTRDDDNKIKLFKLVKGEFKKNSKAFILDFCNYIDTTCVEGKMKKKVRLAAGLRIIYFVKDWGLNIGVDGLEKVAAAKELNFSESSLEVQTIGWGHNDATLDSLKNALQKIGVKNYPEACSSLINLLGAYKSATSLKPEVMPLE